MFKAVNDARNNNERGKRKTNSEHKLVQVERLDVRGVAIANNTAEINKKQG